MTITGTFNGWNIVEMPTVGYSDIEFQMNDAVAISRSPWTQQSYTYPWGSQWWSGTISFPPMSRATIQPWLAFLAELGGEANAFLVGNPDTALPLGVLAYYVTKFNLAVYSAPAGNSIQVIGFPEGQTGLLLPGDNIQIGNRLYMVTEPVTTAADTNIATVSIFPQVRDAPVYGDPVLYTNCQGLFRLAKNQRGWSYSRQHAWGMDALQIIEAL